MQNLRISKVIAGLAVLAVLAGIAIHFSTGGRRRALVQTVSMEPEGSQTPSSNPHLLRDAEATASVPETQELAMVDFDWRQVLTNQVVPPKLPREEVEKYLERNGRSAASLLAAYGALQDTNYLREAATNFPNDPRVQLSVLRRDVFPEERRKWLDLFKASSPENPLANYLSARDYFQSGQSDLAVSELLEAGARPAFKDYSMDFKLDEEELNLSAGRSSLQARLSSSGWAQDLLPELASLKALSQDIAAMQKQYLATGDSGSAENLAQAGLLLADGLRSGDSDRFVIKQLVGNAVEAIMLSQLDPKGSYPFLDGKSPTDRLAELKEQKALLRGLRQATEGALPNMSEAELLSYTERQRLYGELEAMRWLQQRRDASNLPEGPR
jgi:hypothetical protein